MKNQGNMTIPKENRKVPVMTPKKWEYMNCQTKKFKIIVQKMLREFQENTDKQVHNARKTIQ